VLITLGIIGILALALGMFIRKTYDSNMTEFEERVDNCYYYVNHTINAYNGQEEDIEEAVGEIKAMASSVYGRILVVGSEYQIIVDTYDKSTSKLMVDSDVFEVMVGEKNSVGKLDGSLYEKILPIIGRDGNIDAVAVIATDISGILAEKQYMKRHALYLGIAIALLGALFAFAVGNLSVRDLSKIKVKIEGMKDGSMGQMENDGLFAETQDLTQDINDIFTKAQLLEDSRQEFVSNVSHELKTPITSMKVLSESLLTQDDVPAEMYREFMEDIVQEIDREAEIISDLLTLVKTNKGPESLNKEPTDMNEFMDLILKRLKPLADKRSIQMEYESFRDIRASIDKVKFTLAISNLIENGIKYNVDGGWIRVSLNADEKNFHIKVADSGVGIPEDCIGHVFERFYRVDKARSRDTGGTGLGLAITKNIINLHGGVIKVYSEPGKGTTFTVRVPIGDVEANQEDEQEHEREQKQNNI
jgi:signal transduction histidine kinase